MATILPENQINQELNSSVHHFFREQKLGTLLNQSNIRKEAGISPVLLVQFIFSLVLQKKNLYRTLESRGSCQGCCLSSAQQRNL